MENKRAVGRGQDNGIGSSKENIKGARGRCEKPERVKNGKG